MLYAPIATNSTPPPTQGAKKRLANIGFACFFATVPMIVLTVIFLALVFHSRVDVTTIPYPDLVDPSSVKNLGGAYYLSLSGTFITQVSSWTSTIAPICAGMFVTLASYPICRTYLLKTKHGENKALPTPYQLSLLIKFLDGGSTGALLTWMWYAFGWRKRQSQAAPVKQVVAVAASVLVLGFLVFLSDTWLHNTTKAVILPLYLDPSVPMQVGFGLSAKFSAPSCSNSNATYCVISLAATNTFLKNPAAPQEVLHNTSSLATVQVYQDRETGSFSYLTRPQSAGMPPLDYMAATYAIQTQCRPSSRACHLDAVDGATTSFDCSSVFNSTTQTQGKSNPSFYIQYLNDSSMTKTPGPSITSPFYFGLFGNFASTMASNTLYSDPEITNPVHGGTAFVLLCNASVFDVTYISSDNRIDRFETSLSNETVTTLFRTPMAWTTVSSVFLEAAAQAAISTSSSAQEVADKFAGAYSNAAVALGVQAIEPIPAVMSHIRDSRMVTKLEFRPLYVFVAVNMSFVLIGIVLTVWAVCAVSDPAVQELRNRVSVFGLAADRFEGDRSRRPALATEKLFEESDGLDSGRVTVVGSSQGGQEFGLVRGATSQVETEMQPVIERRSSAQKGRDTPRVNALPTWED